MPKRIVILDRINEPSDMAFRFVLWADVPAARQPFYANAAATSAYADATAPELDAIRTGSVAEQVGSGTAAIGTPLADILAKLEVRWERWQDEVTTRNPWVRYGSYWDGTTWTQEGVS